MTHKRLIEIAFPLEQVSLDSVHEKNVRHGHISTLHIWPARRPLAASRAALIATLLPDPGNARERQAVYRRMAGDVVETVEDERVGGRTVARRKRKTQGGILHWKREGGPDVEWFRARVRDAFGGRAPRVLDPFAGGGAIPLEAMRLGCAVTAVDINPVAWFILKCTLDYPRRLAGETRPLPAFALRDRAFMAALLKARGVKGRALKRELAELCLGDDRETEPRLIGTGPALEADLAWQVRGWGRRVLTETRRQLARRYPTYAAFQALKPGGRPFEPRPLTLLAADANGDTDVGPLNAAFDAVYLKDRRNPRWVAKPAVAYLWARTARCKGCRATVPLLKTRWLARKGAKRVRLTMAANADETGVVFGVESDVPRGEGNPARRREHDRRVGAGTMSRSGVRCPLCQAIMTMQDLRLDGRAGRLGEVMTAVVVDGPHGKEYRLPTALELEAARVDEAEIEALYSELPFGVPEEPTPKASVGASRAFSVDGYGFDRWRTLFTNRQLLALGMLAPPPRDDGRMAGSVAGSGGRESDADDRRLWAAGNHPPGGTPERCPPLDSGHGRPTRRRQDRSVPRQRGRARRGIGAGVSPPGPAGRRGRAVDGRFGRAHPRAEKPAGADTDSRASAIGAGCQGMRETGRERASQHAFPRSVSRPNAPARLPEPDRAGRPGRESALGAASDLRRPAATEDPD